MSSPDTHRRLLVYPDGPCRNRAAALCAVAAAAALCLAGPVRAEDHWPQFHGPRRDNTTDAADLPLTWSEAENVAWKTPIPGRGWSSPVVWGDQVWLTTATEDGQRMSAMCLDRDTGRIVHDLAVFENDKPGAINPTNSYASPTPIARDGRVWAHFGTYGTACLDAATGKVVWSRRDLNCDHGVGPGSSPLLAGGRLFLVFDGMDVQFVAALDPASGRTLWQTPRGVDFGRTNEDMRKSFATPALIESGGREQLVVPGAAIAAAYDPATGEELWRFRYPGGYSAAVRPRLAGGLVLFCSGFGRHVLFAVRPDGSGDVTDTHLAWKMERGGPSKPTPVAADGLAYVLHDSGMLACVEAATGEAIWRERLSGTFSASPLLAGGRLYCFDERGGAAVLAAGRQPKVLATGKLDAGCMASPAIAGKALFVRTKAHLYRIEQRSSGGLRPG